MMDAQDVIDVLAVLDDAGLGQLWLDGGWGVEALLGAQHRDHGDVDLVVRIEDLDATLEALGDVGFAVTTDHRPTRMEMMDRAGRVVDLHPVHFDEAGDGWQSGAAPGGGDTCYPAGNFTYGWVAGRQVPCIGPELQVDHHTGYEPHAKDREDLARIRERFSVPVPDAYR